MFVSFKTILESKNKIETNYLNDKFIKERISTLKIIKY